MSRSLSRIAAAGVLALGSLTFLTPATAAGCSSGVEHDVNGDGYAEVAVSEAGRSYEQGAVHVFYGRSSGIAAKASGTARDDLYLDQDEPGVPGTGQSQDMFGSALAFGDFDDDGCSDLAVGAMGDGTAGAIYVFRGSPTGLRSSATVRITHEELLGGPAPGQTVGNVMTAGDLDDDGVTDLAVSSTATPAGATGRGTVLVLPGGAGGLDPDDAVTIDRADAGIPADADGIGSSLAVGDFDGDDVQELAIGFGEGQLQTVEETSSGFVGAASGPYTGPELGVDDYVPYEDDEGGQRVFGQVVAVGDVDGDGDDDLASGMAMKAPGGTVAVVKGSPTGLTAAGVQSFTFDTTGIAGTVDDDEDDAFGFSVAMGRLDAGTTDDLVIGAPGDDIDARRNAGSVVVLLGSPTGLTTDGLGGTRFHQNTSGVPGTVEVNDDLGRAVSVAHVQSKTRTSVIMGAPREKIGTKDATGQVHQLSGSSAGPQGSGSVALNLDSTGVRGASRTEAQLGRTLG